MIMHGLVRSFLIAFTNSTHYAFVLPETIVIDRRVVRDIAQATPDDGPAYGI